MQHVLAEKIPAWREEIRELIGEHGDRVIGKVTVKQVYGGMRGVKALVCDTSTVDPEQGLFIRGIPISKLTHRCPEEIFFLLCAGELPDEQAVSRCLGMLSQRIINRVIGAPITRPKSVTTQWIKQAVAGSAEPAAAGGSRA